MKKKVYKRINPEVVSMAEAAIKGLVSDGMSVTWESIRKVLDRKHGINFSRVSLSNNPEIKSFYDKYSKLDSIPEEEQALELQYKNHSKATIAKQIKKLKAECEELKARNQYLVDQQVLLYRFIESRLNIGVREVESELSISRGVLPRFR